jgi:hypothetical protein
MAKPAPMPAMLYDVLASAPYASAPSSAPIIDGTHLGGVRGGSCPVTTRDNKRQQMTTVSFDKPGRDDTLFHLANHLVKGGMPAVNIEKYLRFFAHNCNPPFPEKDINIKIQSALKRSDNRDQSLTQDIRDLVLTTSDNITTTFVFNCQQVTTREDKKKVLVILGRLVKEGIIERVKGQNGVYRRVESDCAPEDWQNASVETVNIWLPMELDQMIEIPPGSIILVAGAQDAGKSAFMMNIAKENMRRWNVHYFSSELNSSAFKMRVSKFPDITPDQWPIKFYQRSADFQDVIKTGRNDLNLIDYLEVHNEFWRVSEYLANIHHKIGEGIVVVALQKDPKNEYGRGGSFTNEKPILSLAMDYGIVTISKFKGQFKGSNPRGMKYEYKLVDGCRFVKQRGWYQP